MAMLVLTQRSNFVSPGQRQWRFFHFLQRQRQYFSVIFHTFATATASISFFARGTLCCSGGGCCGCCCLCSGRGEDVVQGPGPGAGGGEGKADGEEEHQLHAAASVEAVAAGYSDWGGLSPFIGRLHLYSYYLLTIYEDRNCP